MGGPGTFSDAKRHLKLFSGHDAGGVFFAVFIVETMDVFRIDADTYASLNALINSEHAELDSETAEELSLLLAHARGAEQKRIHNSSKVSYDNPIEKLAVNMNQICNLRCSYCYATGDGTYGAPTRNIARTTAFKAVSDALSAAGDHILIKIFGGEPLLSWKECVAFMTFSTEVGATLKKKIQFEINTNGVLLTEEMVRESAPFPIQWRISLDGDEKVNDLHRKDAAGRGTFTRVINALELLRKHGRLGDTRINAVVHGGSDLDAQWLLLKNFRPAALSFNPMAENGSPATAPGAFQKNAYARLVAAALEESPVEPPVGSLSVFMSRLQSKSPATRGCEGGRKLLAVDSQGNYYPCYRLVGQEKFKIGTVDHGIDREKQKEFLPDSLAVQEKCGDCWARTLCGGGCFAQHFFASGDHRNPGDDSYCEFQRAAASAALISITKRQAPLKGASHERSEGHEIQTR
jgi:uncharacterized protein